MSITIIRERAALGQSGLTKSTMYRRIQAGLFMKPVAISERCVGWVAEHLEKYNALIACGASDEEIRAFVDSVTVPARPSQRRKSRPLVDAQTSEKLVRVRVDNVRVPLERIRLSAKRVRV